LKPGVVVHIYNPSTQESGAGGSWVLWALAVFWNCISKQTKSFKSWTLRTENIIFNDFISL
jgi:hypothetical protein